LLPCNTSVKIFILSCVLVILTWSSATQHYIILDNVLEAVAHMGQKAM